MVGPKVRTETRACTSSTSLQPDQQAAKFHGGLSNGAFDLHSDRRARRLARLVALASSQPKRHTSCWSFNYVSKFARNSCLLDCSDLWLELAQLLVGPATCCPCRLLSLPLVGPARHDGKNTKRTRSEDKTNATSIIG